MAATFTRVHRAMTRLHCTSPAPKPPKDPRPSSPFASLGTDLTPSALGPESSERAIIDALGPTSFTISGVRVTGPVLIMSRFSTLWNVQRTTDLHPAAFTLVKLLAPRPDVLLVGTGAELLPLSRELRGFFKDINVNVESMDTKNACHTFNVLNGESRNVAAALFPSSFHASDILEHRFCLACTAYLHRLEERMIQKQFPAMNKVEAIRKLNDTELNLGIAGSRASWHQTYASCHAIYVGGLPIAYTEGDLLATFEQYGTVVHVHLVRDANSGKSRGFAFVKYKDSRSAVLAVDNFNGVVVGGRTLRIDHAADYTVSEKDEGRGIDTTPQELKGAHSVDVKMKGLAEGTAHHPYAQADRDEGVATAELRRERAVLQRLKGMRGQIVAEDHASRDRKDGRGSLKRRRASAAEPSAGNAAGLMQLGTNITDSEALAIDTDNVNGTNASREQRKRQRKERKAERDRIRNERRQRRAKRENVVHHS